jgi:hypothetical protein
VPFIGTYQGYSASLVPGHWNPYIAIFINLLCIFTDLPLKGWTFVFLGQNGWGLAKPPQTQDDIFWSRLR